MNEQQSCKKRLTDFVPTQSVQRQKISHYLPSFSLLFIIILFSLYAFFIATNNDTYGDAFLPVMLFLAWPRFLQLQQFSFSRVLVCLFWSFLGLTLVSVLLPASIYANTAWLQKALYRLFFSLGIILAVFNVTRLDQKILRWGISVFSILLFSFTIFVSYESVSKIVFEQFTPLPVIENRWNDKYYAFWFVFLTWGAVALLWRRGILWTAVAMIIGVIGAWSIFMTTSESSQLAFVVGLSVFIICQLPLQSFRYAFHMSMFFLMFFIPCCWVLLTPLAPIVKDNFLFNTSTIAGISASGMVGRIPFYDAATQLIHEKLILGYGFGSVLSLPVLPGTFSGAKTLPGGHPHNIVLLFFLEQGLLGVLWFALAIFILFNYLYKATLGRREAPAVWALVGSAQVLFSLSFDIWQADVVMLYAMFFVLLLVNVGSSDVRISQTSLVRNSCYFLMLLTGVGIFCHTFNYFLQGT
jgi:hypothetical protein